MESGRNPACPLAYSTSSRENVRSEKQSLTIHNWESAKSRPRQEQLAALVAVRGIGKREAAKRLELLGE